MMEKYSIGQVSKISGLPAKTIRFYEEKGVIEGAIRGENGYRYYDHARLEEIKLVKYAKDLGLPLTEIKKLNRGCDKKNCPHSSKEYFDKTISDYLKILGERIKQMNNLKNKLAGFQKSGPYCCDILHQLSISDQKER